MTTNFRVIRLLYADNPVSVGFYDIAFYESGPTGHEFEWDGEGTIYLTKVPNAVAKVNVGSATAVLNAGNGHTYAWSGRSDVYNVTSLWPRNGSVSRYIDLARFARSGETLVRQDVFLIIAVRGIFCPVNMDIS